MHSPQASIWKGTYVPVYNVTAQTGKKQVTINMSSITGGLSKNFGVVSSIMCAKILAHDEEKKFGA